MSNLSLVGQFELECVSELKKSNWGHFVKGGKTKRI